MPPEIKAFLESNSIRTVLAMIAIIASVTVSIAVYLLNRKRRSLTYRIVRKSKLFQIDDSLQGRVQVLLDGVATADIFLVIIEVANTGNEPIRAEDFVRPLRFTFGEPAVVLSARVFASKPRYLEARLTHDANSIELAPLLLNANDLVSIEILLTQFKGTIEHSARIVGVSEVKATGANKSHAPQKSILVIVSAAAWVVGGVLLVIHASFSRLSLAFIEGFGEALVTGQALLAVVVGLFHYWDPANDSLGENDEE